MYNTRINVAESELYYNGEIILIYSIEYPEIVSLNIKKENCQSEKLKIKIYNHYFKKIVLFIKEFIEKEIYNQVKSNYRYCKNNKIDFKIYRVNIECNKAKYVENKLMDINLNIELK